MSDFSYDQKDILFATVRRYIEANDTRSLLDIGAGDGSLAVRLSKLVSVYVAVERDKQRIDSLKKADLSFIEGTFPIDVNGEFDMVLVSHAVPEKKEFYKSFLEAAWRKVKKGGELLIITFKGSDNTIMRLARDISDLDGREDQIMFEEMMRVLRGLGEMETEKVTSVMKSKSLDTMVKLASPFNLFDEPQRLQYEARFKELLDKDFKSKEGYYSIPTEHLVISVKKE